MRITQCHVVVFSPTGSTRKLAEAVATGTQLPYVVSDITPPEQRGTIPVLTKNQLVLLASPVYFGRAQKNAVEFFSQLKGQGQAALLMVNYGNRAFEDALLELFHTAEQCELSPVAAGAFVSEHSLATKNFPMATGRPDYADMRDALELGRLAAKKLANGGGKLSSVPGNLPLKPYPVLRRAPVWEGECSLCGVCVGMCPVGAIRYENGVLETDEELCIVCQGCVKSCPDGARHDSASGAEETRQRLAPLIAERRTAEFFL